VASGASRREAAELFEIAASTAVKWLQRLRETGSAAAKPRGGSTSPLEEHAAVILALIEERSDATYAEMLAALAARQIKSRSQSLWRFFARHRITRKKKSLRAAGQKRADVARARRPSAKASRTHVLSGTASIRRQAAAPGIGLRIEVVQIDKFAGRKEAVADVADRALHPAFELYRQLHPMLGYRRQRP
jgi:transposase